MASPHNGRQGPDALGHAVCRDLIGTEQRHHTGKSDLHQLVHPVLRAVGKGDAHDLFQKPTVPAEHVGHPIPHRIFPGKAVNRNCRGGKDPGNQRRVSYTGRPHFQGEHANTVSDHVDHVGCNGDIHCDIGLSDTAAQSRSGVINGQGRQRKVVIRR